MFKREALALLGLLLVPIIVALVMALFGPMILRRTSGTPIAVTGTTTTTLLQWDRLGG